jgi:hypothetical protein
VFVALAVFEKIRSQKGRRIKKERKRTACRIDQDAQPVMKLSVFAGGARILLYTHWDRKGPMTL